MQDYLADVYRLGQGQIWISTTALAERLDVSGPAAVRMVQRLHKRGLVEHQPYQGVRLTPTGKTAALLSVRRHRLVERFLVEVLRFGWHEVHDEAEEMQRGFNQRLEDRIDEIMEHPTACPHGEPIPSREGIMPELDDKPLTVTPTGTKGKITRIKTRDPERLQYLAEIKLVPDTPFELLNRAPFNGPLRLRIGRDEQIIGAELAAAIWVESNTQPGLEKV